MEQYIIGTDIKKADFERLVKKIADQTGMTPQEITENYAISQDVIVVGAYPTPENSVLTFNINADTGNAVPTSKLLAKNDYFLMDGIGLRFSKCDWNAGTYSNHGNYRKLTDVDPAFFSFTKSNSKSEAEALNCVLNGYLSYKVGSEVKIDRHLAQEFTYSPTSTYTSTANPGFGGGEINTRGFLHAVQNHIISGGDDNVVEIALAPGEKSNIDGNISSATTASTKRNVVYLIFSGWSLKSLASTTKCSVTKA